MTNLIALVALIRSQRTGIHTHAIDIIFKDAESYERAKGSGALTRETIAKLYRIPVEHVRVFEYFDQGKSVKASILRPHGIAMGDQEDTDVLGVSQYIPLELIEIP